MAAGSTTTIPIPRNAFGRAEDEITNDFALPVQDPNRPRPRASEPPSQSQAEILVPPEPADSVGWEPLVDDDLQASSNGEVKESQEAAPLLDSLRNSSTPRKRRRRRTWTRASRVKLIRPHGS